MNSRQYIYISAFQLDVDGARGVPAKGLALVSKLQAAGCVTYMPLEWRDYHIIEGEIESHDAVVALVDTYWLSSTWKLSEVTFALDGIGAARVVENHVSLPTFLYPIDDTLEMGFRKTRNPPIILQPSVDKAVAEIQEHLQASGSIPRHGVGSRR